MENEPGLVGSTLLPDPCPPNQVLAAGSHSLQFRMQWAFQESSLLWLARQQGYTKTQLKQAMRERPAERNFMRSVYEEISNTTTHMNTLTFMVKMTISSFI